MKTKVFITIFGASLLLHGAVLKAQTASDLLERGREAYMNYEFSEASKLYSQAKKKAKKTDAEFQEKYDLYHRQLTGAENFLNRVEKIEIIDSISVPKEQFFKAYRLPHSSGALLSGDALPRRLGHGADYVFTNEGEDYMLWAVPDSTGYTRLVESNLLTDGTWSEPSPLSDSLSEDGDEAFPFMMPDGVTLYYADNGENSIGGYDIMVASRDAGDGTFMQPSNLGFPYNSPYDDYLLAIDELNGVGWWATDRNQIEGMVTVYLFKTNDLRSNYAPDEEGLADMARITDYISTQAEDADYDNLLATIRAIDPNARTKKAEFTFAASGGRIYHRYDELPNAAARSAMKQYATALKDLEDNETSLRKLRMEYSKRRTSALEGKIERMEKNLESKREALKKIRNSVYKNL